MTKCLSCDNPAAADRKSCPAHLAASLRNATRRYERLKAAGLCIRCGVVPCAPVVRCEPCAAKSRASAAARAAAKKAAGICYAGCDKPIWRPESSYCIDHRSAYNPHLRKYGPVKGDRCEVCGSTEKLVHDHDHRTDAFRGTLCGRCNVALGMARDDPAILRGLVEYLERSAA